MPNFLHWYTHIFLFGLIRWDIPNSITPQTTSPGTDSGRTAHTPLYPPVQAVPLTSSPLFFFCPGQRNLCLWQVCAITACSECAVKHSDLTWPEVKVDSPWFCPSATRLGLPALSTESSAGRSDPKPLPCALWKNNTSKQVLVQLH